MSETCLPQNKIIKYNISKKNNTFFAFKYILISFSIILTLICLLFVFYYIHPIKQINKAVIKKAILETTLNPIIINTYTSPNHVEGIINNLFYPYTSEIIKNIDEFEFLRDSLGKVDLRMVFNSNVHGDYSTDFHEKTKYYHMLVVIETEKGNRFGGYTSVNFTPESAGLTSNTIEIVKSDECAFLFNLDSKKIFDIKPSEEDNAVSCDDYYTVSFGDNDLLIPNYFLSKEGVSEFPKFYGEGATNNELTGGENTFKIKSMEAFQVLFYSEFGDEKNKMGEHPMFIK